MLYFGNSRAVLGYNCTAQLPPHLVDFPLLFQREVLPAQTPSHGVWSAGFLQRREQWDLDIQRVWNLSLPQELGGTQSFKVSWQVTTPKTKKQLLRTQPLPAMTNKTVWISESIFGLFQMVFPYMHFTFLYFPSSVLSEVEGKPGFFVLRREQQKEQIHRGCSVTCPSTDR